MQINLKEYGAAGDGVTDDSAIIQAAIDELHGQGGGVIFAPKGAYRGNFTLRHQVSIVGEGRGLTGFAPAIDAPVFKAPLNESCNNFRLENFTIGGNPQFTEQDGIRLETSGRQNFIDTVRLTNLHVFNCGGHGLIARGTHSDGPFVQRLYVDDCEISRNWRNVALIGCVIETSIHHSSICEPNDSSAQSYSFLAAYDGQDGGSIPGRVAITGGSIFSNLAGPKAFSPAILLNAVDSFSLRDSSIENADPGIFLDEFSLVRNVTIDGSAFSFMRETQNAIWVKRCQRLSVRGCAFLAGVSITNAIFLDGSALAIPNPDVEYNMAQGAGVLRLVHDPAGQVIALQNGSIPALRNMIGVNGAGLLASLTDENGGTNWLVRGQRTTLFAQGAPFTVQHGIGNIYLNGAADYVISGSNTVTLVWSGGAWIEAGRS